MLTEKEFNQLKCIIEVMMGTDINGIAHIPDKNIIYVLRQFTEFDIKEK